MINDLCDDWGCICITSFEILGFVCIKANFMSSWTSNLFLAFLLIFFLPFKFFLHTSSPGLFGSSRWPPPRHHNMLSLSQDLRLLSSHYMPEPPQPSHPQHITQLPHPTPPCHLRTPHTIPPRDSSQIPEHSSITTKQYSLQSCSKCTHLPPIQHNRSNACFICDRFEFSIDN